MIFYFDVSSLNRPFDDQSQPRIRLEAEAVIFLLQQVDQGIHHHVSSEMVVLEINAAGGELRRKIMAMLPKSSDIIPLSDAIFRRAAELQKLGLKAADAVHVAAAEGWDADVLFSSDDRLCKIAKRNAQAIHVTVINPLSWVQENLQ